MIYCSAQGNVAPLRKFCDGGHWNVAVPMGWSVDKGQCYGCELGIWRGLEMKGK